MQRPAARATIRYRRPDHWRAAMQDETRSGPTIEALLATGAERGCLEESEIDRLAETLELGDADLEDLRDQVAQRGIAVHDDCGRVGRPAHQLRRRRPRAAHDRLDGSVPQGGRALPAAHRRRGARAGQAHRARRPRRQGEAHQPQPAPRRLDRQALPGHRAHDAPGPRPGRDAGADPRRREVRLAQGLPVLHLRDALDPTGDPERARQPGADHPPAGRGRDARTQDRTGPPRARRPARARPDRRGDRRGRRADRRAGRRDPSGREGRHEPRPPGRQASRERRSASSWPPRAPTSARSCTSASPARRSAGSSTRCPIPSARSSGCATASTAGAEPQTYATIGRRLGLSPVRVSAIEKQALEQLALRRELQALADAA